MDCCDTPGLMPLSTGISRLIKAITSTTETELISLDNACGRVLAKPIVATAPVPGFDNSAMDGYAINVESIKAGTAVEIQGKSLAGKPYSDPLLAGKCIRIMTGAPIPTQANAVVMQENVSIENGCAFFDVLPTPGVNIRYTGEEIKKGQIILPSGTLINSVHLALITSVGCASVEVYKKTRVGLISTGDELKSPQETLEYGDIYNSNAPALKQMLLNMETEVIDFGIIPDDPDTLRKTFLKADNECDFVLTSGGVSVGEADYTKVILEELGKIDFWKLAIKPGKPFAFGSLTNSYFIGLPGNPVSAIVTFHILASQAIRQHQNIGYQPMQQLPAIIQSPLKKKPGRLDFQRGIFSLKDGKIMVRPVRTQQGSNMITGLSAANCYIALEENRGDVHPQESVTIWLFDKII